MMEDTRVSRESTKRNMTEVADDVHQPSHTAPVPPLSAATAAAVAPTVPTVAVCQLDPSPYGVQLGSGAVAPTHGSASSANQPPTTPPKVRAASPKRPKDDPNSPEPAPAPQLPATSAPPVALPADGTLSQQQVLDELNRMRGQHSENAVWKQAVDGCLQNHKLRLVRDRAKIVGLQAGLAKAGTNFPKGGSGSAPADVRTEVQRLERLIEQRTKHAEDGARAVDARVTKLEADLNAYAAGMDERLQRTDAVTTDDQKRLEGLLRQYTSKLEAKLTVLEGSAGDAAHLAQAAQQGTATLEQVVPSLVKLHHTVANMQATCDLRDQAQRHALVTTEEEASLNLTGVASELKQMQDVFDSMSTAIQIYETGTDAAIERLQAEAQAARQETRLLTDEVRRAVLTNLHAPVREPPGFPQATQPQPTGSEQPSAWASQPAAPPSAWASQPAAYHQIFSPIKTGGLAESATAKGTSFLRGGPGPRAPPPKRALCHSSWAPTR